MLLCKLPFSWSTQKGGYIISANAVIYARFSSYGQQEQSIEGQVRDAQSYAERQGYHIVNIYADRAISGTTDQRPAFQQMIADSAKKQFEIVLVWKLDRFARNRYDSATYKARLRKNGVHVESVMEPLTAGNESIILEGLLESMAEYYSANLSQNVKRGQRESILKGNWTGGQVPYGYKVEDKKLIIREDAAAIVREIYQRYADGEQQTEICKDLNSRGLRTYSGCKFTKASLETMLKNQKYIGHFQYGENSFDDESIRIVTDDLFHKVQAMRIRNKKDSGAANATVEYLLRGKVFCGHCGTHMTSDCGRSRSGAMMYYYSCQKRKKGKTCSKKLDRKEFLEWYVTEQTALYVLDPARVDVIAEAVQKAYDKEFNDDEIRNLERDLAKVEREANGLVDLIIEATGNKAIQKRYQDKLELLEARKADLQDEISKLRIACSIRCTHDEIVAWLKSVCRGDPLDMDFQRKIIDTFINSVYVYDDKIVIFFNVKGGKQISYMEVSDALEEELTEDPEGESPTGKRFDTCRFSPARNRLEMFRFKAIFAVLFNYDPP